MFNLKSVTRPEELDLPALPDRFGCMHQQHQWDVRAFDLPGGCLTALARKKQKKPNLFAPNLFSKGFSATVHSQNRGSKSQWKQRTKNRVSRVFHHNSGLGTLTADCVGEGGCRTVNDFAITSAAVCRLSSEGCSLHNYAIVK